ncbi:MAG: type II/IV secretion system protein, partial [Planctomycetes bacterium]|nr:type II/IV secretion system protein [Planctomycetota bacterium]
TTIDLVKINIPREVIGLLQIQSVKKHQIIPVSKKNGVITIAVSIHPDLGFIDNLRFVMNADIKHVLVTPENIKNAIRKYYEHTSVESVNTLLKEMADQQISIEEVEIEQVKKLNEEAGAIEDDGPIIQLVSLIINRAVAARASDIHIEPFYNKVRVRYRIDGVCQEADILPKRLQDSIASRIKILASIDISEKRRPQDGHIGLKYKGADMDIRVSCLPSIYGESIVMRLLEKSAALLNLNNLNFYENDFKRLQAIIKRPNGILLITGPTGSGKTTTLYATLNELNKAGTKIITAEDPVEYTIAGINQSEANEKTGLTFPIILKTMLRQDPNVIMVGEIRDAETADIAIAAALTGHLVLSTLHTNDAPSTITRLINMGVKPFLVATSLQGIMAQRLVRCICKQCKEQVDYTAEQLLGMGFDAETLKGTPFYKGKGCKECNNIGYRGRMGIYELMEMNETLRDMTYHMASTDDIRKVARTSGMTTLKEDGLRKAKDGKITLEEVFMVAGIED